MLPIAQRPLSAVTLATLASMQTLVDGEPDYPAQVLEAGRLWKAKTTTKAREAAFADVRATLERLCIGARRCHYCEDSLADEVEHILPKNLFPGRAFIWANYCFACGPCNGPKSNRYGVVRQGKLEAFVRRKDEPVVPPPAGRSACIDPRAEDATQLLELDLGGVAPDGQVLAPTGQLLPRPTLGKGAMLRAEFSIDVLGLNRELLCAARRNAYGGFRARLVEYAALRDAGGSTQELAAMRDELLLSPHLTVFHEMRRQRAHLPKIDALLQRAPEALDWPLVPA